MGVGSVFISPRLLEHWPHLSVGVGVDVGVDVDVDVGVDVEVEVEAWEVVD